MNAGVLLGRTAAGERVFANIRLTHHTDQARETIEHRHTVDYWSFAVMFELYEPRRRNPYAVGQIPAAERVITQPALGAVSPADRLLIEQYWLDWHLNDMHAECAHMTELDPPAGAFIPARHDRPDVQGWRLKNLICPATGYRYGSAWLLAPLPDDVLANVQRILGGAL